MKKIIHDHAELVRRLQDRLKINPGAVIAVDGVMGAGKTTLARYLGEKLKAAALDLDDELAELRAEPAVGREGYRQRLNLKKLKTEISSHLKSKRPLIIEGVLLLEILGALKISADVLIYSIPAEDSSKFRFYRRILSGPAGLLKQLARDEKKFPHAGIWLDKEVVRYHQKFLPAEKADLIFQSSDWA